MILKNKPAFLLAAALLAGISPAAAQSALAASAEVGNAAISPAAQSAAASIQESAGSGLNELRLKAGSRRITINGDAEVILRAPYRVNGTTMVPLSVFASAFGADSRLGDGDVVKLTIGTRKVTLTIGSPVLWTNKGKSRMDASPAMVGGVLMVPLRPVAEGFGASISSSNGEVVVKLSKALSGQPGKETAGDNQSSPAMVGNSYYGWSMDNPGDLVGQASQDESSAVFSDPNGNYYLQIHVAGGQPDQDGAALLDNLAEEVKANQETVLHEEVVRQGDVSYARMITSDEDGMLAEIRSYYNDHKVYLLYFTLADAYVYQDFNAYAGLLDSFRTSYDAGSSRIEDLSHETDGRHTLYNEVYGIGVTLPEGWSKDDNGTDFNGPDGARVRFSVSSNPEGQTADSWAEQMKQRLNQLYVPAALRVEGVSLTEASDEKAAVLKAEVNAGDGWKPVDQVMWVVDDYRYFMEYQGPVQAVTGTASAASDSANANSNTGDTGSGNTGDGEQVSADSADSTFDAILNSVDIPFSDIEDYYGKLEDRALESDLSKMVIKSSAANGFTIQIPRYWTPVFDQFDQTNVQYSFPGGSFKLAMIQTDAPEQYLGNLAGSYAAAASSGSGVTVSTDKTVVSGTPATVFTLHTTQDGVPLTKRIVAFSHKGTFYQLTFALNDANATDEQKTAMSKVEKSFKFGE
ncbi:hypothetical protein AWM70_16920 [Paenibacillus yonginensis]|uniref:Copper amine oxidase-like N-terminal domain-containing protein n=1 Tax=Paenibacillus yonginensis TaxID=1462996 RepID=A0A1B1N3T1_9BACL|nr:copper amine oxidase N-terminal domain-containing protein [Paenibacillus yonginensis]ANS76055.1 hypothetical protein AWM70_16920 [Paenibacillus yonginensis]